MEELVPEVRPGATALHDNEVITHVDRVLDFTLPPHSPSWESYESETSGIPDDSVEDECSVRHNFSWQLGVADRRHSPRRASVHERLGDRCRDRSPPGGGAEGRGKMQYLLPQLGGFTRARGSSSGA